VRGQPGCRARLAFEIESVPVATFEAMNFTPRDWHALSRLLDVALALPAAERESWLEQLESDDQSLQPLLHELFRRHDLSETDAFLSPPPHLARLRVLVLYLLLRARAS
jgi:hypothetical protein